MKRIALIASLVLTVTLMTLAAPVASAADGALRAMPTDYAKADLRNATKQYGLPRAMPSHYAAQQVGLPRAMPSDYAKADVGNVTKQYGTPRAMPSHYAASGVTPGQQVGLPRAMPSDYAAAGIDVQPTHAGGRSHGVSDSSSDVLVAVAVGIAGAVLLTGLTLVLRSRRRFAS
jgi:2-hydroxychromene-2-carboxylate isomerase